MLFSLNIRSSTTRQELIVGKLEVSVIPDLWACVCVCVCIYVYV